MLVMYQCQKEARQPPNSSSHPPKEKQIEDVTGKFRYDRFGYLCMVYSHVTVFKYFVILKWVIRFDKVFLD